MKYAHWEAERRFLLSSVPPLVGPAVQLHDRYLLDTRLRLRRMIRPGEPAQYKLGQKIPGTAGWPPAVAHTSLYLDASEYELLAQLPANSLSKNRTLTRDGVAVDVFTGRLAGLVLAEYELDPASVEPDLSELPVIAEVTDDARFSGAALAGSSAAELARLLAGYCR